MIKDAITWREVRPSQTTSSSYKTYQQFRNGALTGKTKTVYPPQGAANNEIIIIYEPNKNSDATSPY